MSEDTIFWQAIYGRASDRCAYLYLRKATQGYDFQKEEITDLDVVMPEMENLRRSATYFSSQGKSDLAGRLRKAIVDISLEELSQYAQEHEKLAEEKLRLKEISRQASERAFREVNQLLEEIYGAEEHKSMSSRILTLLPQAVRKLVSRTPTCSMRRINLPRSETTNLDFLVEKVERELYRCD